MIDDNELKKIINNLTLEEKIGQLLMENFIGKYEIPDKTKEAIIQGRIGNIIYFSGCNVESGIQLAKLSTEVHNLFLKTRNKIPPIIAIDQEGGQLTAIRKDATITPGNMAIGATKDFNNAYIIGKITGKELKAMNITMNLAPVIDTASNQNIPVFDNRFFGDNAEFVGKMGINFIKGCQSQNVATCAKHFPGLSNSLKDTHNDLNIIDKPMNVLEKNEFLPFKMAVNGGVAAILTNHSLYPFIDKKYPATLSKKIINDYLRKKLNFNGVVISDDLYMKAIIKNYGLEEAALIALNAGVDIILAAVSTETIFNYLLKMVRKWKLSIDTVNDALERILKLKSKYAKNLVSIKKTLKVLNNKISIQHSQKIADKAITVIKNEERLIPLKIKKYEKICIIQPPIIRLCMSDTSNLYGGSILKEEIKKRHKNTEEHIIGINPTRDEIDSLHDNVFISDVIIACTSNAFKYKKQIDMIKMILEFKKMGKKIITVSLRSPGDFILYPETKTHIATYGNWGVLMKSFVKILFGEIKSYGRLPVSINSLYKLNFEKGDQK